VTSAQLPLWLGDRSSGSAGKAYHDNISIYSNSQVTNSDLAVSNFSFSPQTITAGLNPEVVSFRLTNNGPANLSSPNTRVDGKFYISKNTTFGDSDDIQIGVNGYDFTVASGGYTDVTLSATGMSYLSVPTSTAAGSYYVFVQVVHMPPSGLTDPTPSNNYAMQASTIHVVNNNSQTLVFSDNFTDLSKWTLYGSPLPLNPATAKGRTGIFDNNGDSNYNSGAISKNTFLFAKNTKIVSEVYLDFSDLSGCWNSASIGIANTEYKSWGGYDPYLSFSLTANGDACWASPANTRRHAVFYAGYLSTTGQVNFGSDMLTVADNYMNKWVKLTIEIDDNGVPAFYADNALIFKGTQPLATAVTSAQLPLWLGDRSSGSAGKAYHDNISIYSNSQESNNSDLDNYVLENIMSGVKIVERIKSGTITLSVDQNKMLADKYSNCVKIGDYVVYTKTAQSLDPTDWSCESNTCFTGDRLPANLQIKFAWKSDGTVYMGAIGSDDEVLASIADGNVWIAGAYLGKRTFFEGFALKSELNNMKKTALVSGIQNFEDLNTLEFFDKMNSKIFNRFSKPIFKLFSSVVLISSPGTYIPDEFKNWCPYPGIATGTGSRSFNLNFTNKTNSYVCATADNDNSNSSYVKINGSIVAQKSKYADDYYRRTAIYPNSVEIGTTIVWSSGAPNVSMAFVCDNVTASNLNQSPAGGLSNNHAPIIISIPVYSGSQVTNSDLAVSNFSFSPQTITAGLNPEVVSFRLTNNGPANLSSPNTRVDGKFYISKNTTFGDSDDIQIGVNGYDFTVASGGYTDVTLSATGMSYLSVPTSTAAGSYNVFVQVVHMPPSGLTDPTPSNNYAMRTGTISVVSGETATLKIGTVNGSIGNNVSIPVTATSIKDIAGFQFTLEYDATKLSYVNCTNWPSNVSGITVSNPKAGKITFVYSDPNNLVNITSGKFFDVNFNVIAASGTPLILWSDDPTARLFVNSNLETLNCAYINGSVSIITGFKLSGSLAYDNTNMTPLINEGITLLNSSGQSTGNNFTDGSGLFSFDGLSNDTYILKPVVTLPWGNSGVNVTDVLIYKQFIAKSRTLSSFRERAGDVNGSGLPVNVTDVLLIMRRLGDPSKTFTAGDWLFDNTSAVINNSGKSGQNILALCYGDANGSYTPTTNKSASNIFVEGNDKVKMLTNNEFEVPFRIDNTINNLAAVGLTFSYPYEIFEVREIKMTKGNEDLYYTAIDGTIRIVFATLNTFEQPSDQPLFTIRFKLKENADFYEIEKSTSIFAGFGDFADVTAKEFHGLNVIYGGINKDLIEQLIKNKEVKIYPNPAKNFVNITNVENSEISVSDIHGRMVMKVIGNSNLFRLDLDGLKTGVYLISVKKDQYIANEKITFIK
jgi:hypothetical protein